MTRTWLAVAKLFSALIGIAACLLLVVLGLQTGFPEHLSPALRDGIYVVLLYSSFLGLIKYSRTTYPFPSARKHPGASLGGFALAMILVSLAWIPGFMTGRLLWTPHLPTWTLVIELLCLSWGIAWIEELLFRGLLFTLFRTGYSTGTAIVLQAVIFSLLHQLRGEWGWEMRLGSGLGLFLTAIVLAQFRVRSHHLGWSIGLHSGWIFMCQWADRTQSIRLSETASGLPELLFQEVNPISGISGMLLLTAVSYVIMKANRTHAKCCTSER